MSSNSDVRDPPDSERINELYWNSDQTIDDITEKLGVSRNALYTAIHPLAAGVTCAECGERMVFTNRTRRDSATAVCRACGAEAGVERGASDRPMNARGSWAAGGRADREPERGESGAAAGWARWRGELALVEPERFVLVGGAAALGAMLGAVAARVIRDRI